ncbi:MAG: TfuA-like protein [Rhodospirillales bacterium]
MTLYVFLGPSLPLDEARRICPAVYLPPVRLGDVHRCVEFGGATAIGIIDGYFERVPAVWHKEILWALSNGVAVAGAASMGALRAAELAPFGMQGIGRIFEAYVRGAFAPFDGEPFEDDDEVAVVHGPAEAGWMATEAMVNIRATLAAAAEGGMIESALRDRLAAAAKAMFYKDRSWATLLHRAGADSPDEAEALGRLRAWLPTGRIDQKRLDAIALLQRLATNRALPTATRFAFGDTTLWRRAVAVPADAIAEEVLVELRLTGDAWIETRDAAWTALMGEAGGGGEPLPDPAVETEPARALAALEALARREARSREQAAAAGPLLDAAILERLRGDGRYAGLHARAMAKRRLAATATDEDGEPETGELLAVCRPRRHRRALLTRAPSLPRSTSPMLPTCCTPSLASGASSMPCRAEGRKSGCSAVPSIG